MDSGKLKLVIKTIMGWCSLYGYNILRYPENLRSYASKQMTSAQEIVDLCADVISTDGFVDCLMWCRYFANDPQQLKLCVDSFAERLRRSGNRDANDMDNVFRAFASEAAGTLE